MPASPVATAPVASTALAVSAVPVAPAMSMTSDGALRPSRQLTLAEQEEITERLVRFRRFDPSRFVDQSTESWETETWVAAMEKVFDDLFSTVNKVLYAIFDPLVGIKF